MSRKAFSIVLLFAISAIFRFWKLEEIPPGLSLEEVKLGLIFSKFFGEWVTNGFFVRLPFAIIGLASVFLFFQAVRKLGEDFRFAYVASFLLAILPWHIGQSRVYSAGLLVFTLALVLVILFAKKLRSNAERVGRIGLVFALVVFVLSVFLIPQELRFKVNEQRNTASKLELNFPILIFSNKLIESYRFREKLIFENLDFGNYFFTGHPRERWAIEEPQKLYLAIFPLILLGVSVLGKKLGWFLLGWSSLTLTLSALFGARGPSATLPLVFPIIFLITSGVFRLRKLNWSLSFLAIIFILEFLIFSNNYFSELSESRFSPRRPIYKEVTSAVKLLRRPQERILVTNRLGNSSSFFKFYLGEDSLKNYEFRYFSIWQEKDLDKLFVDALPDDPKPDEPLYQQDSSWPVELNVLGEFYDKGKRQNVVLYRMK